MKSNKQVLFAKGFDEYSLSIVQGIIKNTLEDPDSKTFGHSLALSRYGLV